MEGIQSVIDDGGGFATEGEKTAVLIDLKEHGELEEDFYDSLIARERANEPRESLDLVRERLRQQGELNG